MKTRYKILALFPLIALTSCGYGLKDAIYGNQYNSPIFSENFYTFIDGKIKNAELVNTIKLNKFDNLVFENYGDANFVDRVDPNRSRSYRYTNWDNKNGNFYGRQSNLSLVDESFNYGYISKLFDGRMFCGGLYQLSRVQIDENGFGVIFKKEIGKRIDGVIPYFAIQFKSSVDYTEPLDKDGNPYYKDGGVKAHLSDITFNVSLYLKSVNKSKLDKYTYSYDLKDLETNHGDYVTPDDSRPDAQYDIYDIKSNYKFYGFSLENLEYERCVGFSIDYKVTKDEYFLRKENPRPYSLMIYEVFFQNLTWN